MEVYTELGAFCSYSTRNLPFVPSPQSKSVLTIGKKELFYFGNFDAKNSVVKLFHSKVCVNGSNPMQSCFFIG